MTTTEEFKYLANVKIAGKLLVDEDTGRVQKLASELGTFKVSGILPSLKKWLKIYAPDEAGRNEIQSWLVYPETDNRGRIRSVQLAGAQLTPLEIPDWDTSTHVNGDIAWYDNAESKIKLRICRNLPVPEGLEDRREWKYRLVMVSGHLPGIKVGQKWSLQCEIENKRIVLLDGQKWSCASLIKVKKSPDQLATAA